LEGEINNFFYASAFAVSFINKDDCPKTNSSLFIEHYVLTKGTNAQHHKQRVRFIELDYDA
tara:strand:+ start:1911 stop:2093 length:183 start_codon:yes stop_codon:yes gene_type:complete